MVLIDLLGGFFLYFQEEMSILEILTVLHYMLFWQCNSASARLSQEKPRAKRLLHVLRECCGAFRIYNKLDKLK
jgi:hypothetical protein